MMCNCRTAVKGDGKHFFAVSLPCRAWTCPDCAPKRQADLIAFAIDGSPNRFLTLTSKRREGMTPAAAARELARCWRLVRLRLMRKHKTKSLPFLAVFEATKLGWPHLHILLRCNFLDVRDVSRWMEELAGSPVVWIEKLDSAKKGARYCAKYISKDSVRFGTSKRYWHSKDYRLRPRRHARLRELPPGDWYVHKFTLEAWMRDMRELGFEVTPDSPSCAYATLRPG